MNISNKTIQYSIYDRGNGRPEFILDTSQIKRPSLEMLSDTVKGAGIAGEIDLPTLAQLGSMEYEITFNKTNKQAISLFGQKTQSIENRWVSDRLNSTTGELETEASKEIVKGIPKSLDMGSIENNSSNEAKVVLEVLYYNYIVDGTTILEIDKLNNVFKVNGVDYATAIRQAL